MANSSTSIPNSSTSDTTSVSTPIREYKFHKTIKNTYGRAKPTTSIPSSPSSSPFSLDSPSSSDPWSNVSIPQSNENSPSVQPQRRKSRSRLSGSFADLITPNPDPWDTPTRTTRTLTEKLARAKLELSDHDSVDDNDSDQDKDNVFLVRRSKSSKQRSTSNDHQDNPENSGSSPRNQTPKRKRQNLAVATRQSPRSKKFIDLLQENGQEDDSDQDQTLQGLNSSRGRSLSRSPSPESPPSSPSQRNSNRKRTRLMTIPVVEIPKLALSPEKSTSTSTTINNTTARKPSQQATLAAFFTSKAGSNGTGILKGRSQSTKDDTQNASVTTATDSNCSSTIPKKTHAATKGLTSSSTQEPQRKLEQLFLSFSKDRTKSLPSKSNSVSSPTKSLNSGSTLSNRKPVVRVQREDEKSKRYHCPQCGMPYVRGQSEDEQIHDRYHRAALGGIDYPGYKNEIVAATFNDFKPGHNPASGTSASTNELYNSRIVVISMSDTGKSASLASGASSFEKRKVKEVLQIVNKDLGSVDFEPEKLDSCKAFLYISGKKKVIGCVIAERIKQGFEIIPQATSSSTPTPSTTPSQKSCTDSTTSSTILHSSSSTQSTLEISSTPGYDEHERGDSGSAIFCSTTPCPAICGINRIWVSSHCRRQGVASRLLEAVRDRFIYACTLKKSDLAFSQPTGDGKALAQQYLGTEKFLVYIE
ncbi:N-acetyltransferase esco2 [Entomortierella beljakovae]|nr:N-acetyltransferase esco2 [Entomortierella beljakovae]